MILKKAKGKIEFIAVGSELLSSGFLETNSLFLEEKLEELGWTLSFKTVVSDRLSDLKEAIREAGKRSWLILMSGGLGPTEDDRTKQALAAVLRRRLVFRPDILEKIKERFESRGLVMPSSNRRQAYIIEGSKVLDNPHGTAPGLWLKARNRIYVLLPGPPRELKPMVENQVLPRLKSFGRVQLLKVVLRVTGAGESWIEDQIRPVYKLLPSGLELTTLASPGDIQIRLSMPVARNLDKARKDFNLVKNEICRLLGDKIYSLEGESLEKVIGDKLTRMKKTLATAESCSGGLLASRITDVPGSSNYFLEGMVVYSNQSKIRELGVSENLLKKKGAVSQEVAEVLAANMRKKAATDFALATTGIAGPSGGSKEKPVGLVYIGLATPEGTVVEKNLFRGDRELIKFQATQKALDMLRLKLIEIEKEQNQ